MKKKCLLLPETNQFNNDNLKKNLNIHLAASGLSCSLWAQLPHGMWDLGSPAREQTCRLRAANQTFTSWTTREVPSNGNY